MFALRRTVRKALHFSRVRKRRHHPLGLLHGPGLQPDKAPRMHNLDNLRQDDVARNLRKRLERHPNIHDQQRLQYNVKMRAVDHERGLQRRETATGSEDLRFRRLGRTVAVILVEKPPTVSRADGAPRDVNGRRVFTRESPAVELEYNGRERFRRDDLAVEPVQLSRVIFRLIFMYKRL